jgi:hypothetical protein
MSKHLKGFADAIYTSGKLRMPHKSLDHPVFDRVMRAGPAKTGRSAIFAKSVAIVAGEE